MLTKGPHDTSPARLRQVAEDLRSEGWYTWGGTLAQLADELDEASEPTEDDSPYCDCGAIADEEETASNRCSCCGKRIDA